jgi:hypothetical protein
MCVTCDILVDSKSTGRRFYRFPPDRIAELLYQAGMVEVARLVRSADQNENTPQAFLMARKP